MTAEEYVDQVVRCLPPPLRLRTPIGMEVRSHIAERVEHGQSIDEAARQLGDPTALAASYVAVLPLTPASFWPRAAAKIIDVLVIVAAVLPLLLIVPLVQRLGPFLVLFIIVFASAVFFGYLVIAEYLVGQTLGKRLLGMCVVRESGTRIGLGQAAAVVDRQIDEPVRALAHVADAALPLHERLLVDDAPAVEREPRELLAGQTADEELPRHSGKRSPV
jgi:uncharacterized membrane protein